MALEKVWILPFFAAFFAFLAFFIGYVVAVSDGHVKLWISFISDGGTHPPESCIFGQLLNMSAMFVAATAYVRHLHIVYFYGKLHRVQGRWRMASALLMYLGYFIAFGISLVANFQETSVAVVHGISASFVFIFGVAYLWGQVVLARITKPMLGSPFHNILRTVMVVITTVALIIHLVFLWGKPLVRRTSDGKLPQMPKKNGIIWVDPESPHFVNHVIAVSSEWILGICLYLCIVSFAIELREMEAHLPKLTPKSRNLDCTYGNGFVCAYPQEQATETFGYY